MLQLLALIASLYLALVCPAAAQALDGVWTGTGLQRGRAPSMYPIEMTLKGDSGTIEYPSLECGGTLTKKAGQSALQGYQHFVEKITHGSRCADGGTVYVKLEGGRLVWFWGNFAVIAVLDQKH